VARAQARLARVKFRKNLKNSLPDLRPRIKTGVKRYGCLDGASGTVFAPSAREATMKVHQIMSEPVVTCTGETTLSAAARLMRDADYGTLPVIDRQQHLAGIITDRDLCLAFANTARRASEIAVQEVMTRRIVTVVMTDPVAAALAAMKRARVRRLPVVDHFGHLKGILSIEDVILRGLETGGLENDEIVDALRTVFERRPVLFG
jgi:CBS domain-containing protein